MLTAGCGAHQLPIPSLIKWAFAQYITMGAAIVWAKVTETIYFMEWAVPTHIAHLF
jgi:hypothetical protein